MTRVKICCTRSIAEGQLAVQAGAAAVGLVSAMPCGPGVIPATRIAAIAASVPPPVATFLLTSRTDPTDIVAQQRRTRANSLQICDRLPPGAHAVLRESLPGVALVQVIHVGDAGAAEEAQAVATEVDALLLDSGTKAPAAKELGGTGRTHDWTCSAAIVARSPIPVFLAGGLTAANVDEAIRTVRPFGVDVCSGVRTAGDLDERKLASFMVAVARADAEHA